MKEAFFEGYTQVFKPKGTNLYFYDINSHYPASSLSMLPTGSLKYYEFSNMKYEDFDQNILGVYHAKVEIPLTEKYPILPVKHPEKGIIYPVGEITGHWSSIELDYALLRGYKINIISALLYSDKNDVLFKDYVNTMYHNKSISKGFERSFYKSMLNNLIGRFSLNFDDNTLLLKNINSFNLLTLGHKISSVYNLEDSVIFEVDRYFNLNLLFDNNIEINKYINNEEYTNLMKEIKQSRFIKGTSIVTTLFINAEARLRLFRLIHELESQNTNIYYCDNNSIVVNKPLPDKLISDKLGDFKLKNTVKKGLFISGKLYYLLNEDGSTKVVNKGLSNKLSYYDFTKLYKGLTVKGVTNHSTKHVEEGFVNIHDINITLSGDYNKRIKVFDSKNKWVDTKPYVYKNNELIDS